MTPTCLGSPGAARVFLAAGIGSLGFMWWDLPGGHVLHLSPWRARQDRWELVGPNPCDGYRIPRETARLILRGLLAEGVARKLVEWAQGDRDGFWPDLVLAKLRELGMT